MLMVNLVNLSNIFLTVCHTESCPSAKSDLFWHQRQSLECSGGKDLLGSTGYFSLDVMTQRIYFWWKRLRNVSSMTGKVECVCVCIYSRPFSQWEPITIQSQYWLMLNYGSHCHAWKAVESKQWSLIMTQPRALRPVLKASSTNPGYLLSIDSNERSECPDYG